MSPIPSSATARTVAASSSVDASSTDPVPVPASSTSAALAPGGGPAKPSPAPPPKRLTREEIEKQKREEAIARKKALDARYKNRGKRRLETAEEGVEKRPKKEKEMSAYEREVAEINKRVGLSDSGAGVRAVTK